jgi:DNA repair protein RadC
MPEKQPTSLNKNILKAPEITVHYHPKITKRPFICFAIDAYALFLDFFPKNSIELQERVVVMYLNQSKKVLGIYLVSVGGLTNVVTDIRLIFSVALKTAATSIIIAHNHPSGSLKPSQNDIDFTKKVIDAGQLLDIKVLDHIIIAPGKLKFYSFSREGLI